MPNTSDRQPHFPDLGSFVRRLEQPRRNAPTTMMRVNRELAHVPAAACQSDELLV